MNEGFGSAVGKHIWIHGKSQRQSTFIRALAPALADSMVHAAVGVQLLVVCFPASRSQGGAAREHPGMRDRCAAPSAPPKLQQVNPSALGGSRECRSSLLRLHARVLLLCGRELGVELLPRPPLLFGEKRSASVSVPGLPCVYITHYCGVQILDNALPLFKDEGACEQHAAKADSTVSEGHRFSGNGLRDQGV